MKLNKYFLGFAVAMLAGLSACNTDVEGTLYNGGPDNISFEVTSKSVSVPNTESTASIPVRITRANTASAYQAHYTAVASANGIFSDDANGVINFEAGQGSAVINVSANNLEKETAYTYTMTLSEADVNSADTIVNNQNTTMTISVNREGDWSSIGTALYREDLLTSFWNVDNLEYELEVLESEVTPGIYRLVNPYGEAYAYNEPGDWDDSKNYYIEMDCTNPDQVYIKSFDLGIDWGYGMVHVTSFVDYIMADGLSLDEVRASYPQYFGTLKDGVITMPAQSLLISMPGNEDGALYYSNGSGLFRVVLPGASVADYSAEMTYQGVFTNPAGETFAMADLTLGADATNAKAIVAPLEVDPEAVADGLAAGDYEGVEVEAGQIRVPISEDLTGELQIIVAIIEEGEVKNVVSAKFEYFGGSASPWKKLGTGYLTDDFVTSMFVDENKNPYPPETVEVQIEESNETPGLYRIKNAYASIAASFGAEGGNEDLIIHAEDPNGVYFLTSPLGFDLGNNYTNITIISYGGSAIEYFTDPNNGGYPIATVINAYADDFGKLENGVITFPGIQAQDQDGNPRYYSDGSPYLFQGYTYMSGQGYYGGMNVAFKVVLPSAAAAVKAKAKALAAKSAHTHHKANLSNNSLSKTKMTRSQMRKALFAKKLLPKASMIFKR